MNKNGYAKMKHTIIIKRALVICLLINIGLSYAMTNSNKTEEIKYSILLTKADIAYQNSK